MAPPHAIARPVAAIRPCSATVPAQVIFIINSPTVKSNAEQTYPIVLETFFGINPGAYTVTCQGVKAWVMRDSNLQPTA